MRFKKLGILLVSLFLCLALVGPAHADLTSETYKTIFNCDGATVDFDYDFKVFVEGELEVILYTNADGTELTLTLTTDYSVSGIASSGGRVTTVATYSNAYKLIVRRDQPFTQNLDYTPNSGFSTTVLEKQLDQIVMQIQDLLEQVSRSLLQGSTALTQIEFPGAVADEVIGWNSGGTGLENKDVVDLGTIAVDTDGTLAADSDSRVASQKAGKTYTDAQIALQVPLTYLDTDVTLAADSDTKVATQKATKAYVDTDIALQIPLTYLDTDVNLAADSDTKIATQKATKAYVDAITPNYYVSSFTRDTATASGTQAITGVGVQPSGVTFFTTVPATSKASWGVDDGTRPRGLYDFHGETSDTYNLTTANSIVLRDNVSNFYEGRVTAWGADGFTITWTKTGSPTGTATIAFKADK